MPDFLRQDGLKRRVGQLDPEIHLAAMPLVHDRDVGLGV
jgi:hypothetical protein